MNHLMHIQRIYNMRLALNVHAIFMYTHATTTKKTHTFEWNALRGRQKQSKSLSLSNITEPADDLRRTSTHTQGCPTIYAHGSWHKSVRKLLLRTAQANVCVHQAVRLIRE